VFPFAKHRFTTHLQLALLLAGWDCGLKPSGGVDVCPLANVVCLQVEFCVAGWSLVQRSPTECGVPACNREASIIWGTGPLGVVAPWKTKIPFPFLSYADCQGDLPSPESSKRAYPAKSWFHSVTPVLQSQKCIRWELKYVQFDQWNCCGPSASCVHPASSQEQTSFLRNYLEENPS